MADIKSKVALNIYGEIPDRKYDHHSIIIVRDRGEKRFEMFR